MVFPSVARMRIEGLDDGVSSSCFRGFCVRKMEPRASWEVLDRRSVREVKNCCDFSGYLLVGFYFILK